MENGANGLDEGERKRIAVEMWDRSDLAQWEIAEIVDRSAAWVSMAVNQDRAEPSGSVDGLLQEARREQCLVLEEQAMIRTDPRDLEDPLEFVEDPEAREMLERFEENYDPGDELPSNFWGTNYARRAFRIHATPPGRSRR